MSQQNKVFHAHFVKNIKTFEGKVNFEITDLVIFTSPNMSKANL